MSCFFLDCLANQTFCGRSKGEKVVHCPIQSSIGYGPVLRYISLMLTDLQFSPDGFPSLKITELLLVNGFAWSESKVEDHETGILHQSPFLTPAPLLYTWHDSITNICCNCWLLYCLLILCRGCCLIPLCVKRVKDVKHICPVCEFHITTYRRDMQNLSS